MSASHLPPPPMPYTAAASLPRSIHAALALTGLLWLLAARTAADKIATLASHAIGMQALRPMLDEMLWAILLLTGFAALSWVATHRGGIRAVNALPKRPSANREWQQGATLGWGMLLLAAVPMVLAGDLHPQFWFQPRAWGLGLLSLFALLAASLAWELAFRGFVFRSLIAAWGPVVATLMLSGFYALLATFQPNTTALSFLVTFIAGIVFSLAYLRTHGLWMGWGLHFGWMVAMGLVLGLPVAGSSRYANLVATDTTGAVWLTGGAYGPEGSLPALLALALGIAALYAITRDYAWEYTYQPIVAGGYPLDVPPSAAHRAMEAQQAPAPLVHIQMATPAAASTIPAVVEHLAASQTSFNTEPSTSVPDSTPEEPAPEM